MRSNKREFVAAIAICSFQIVWMFRIVTVGAFGDENLSFVCSSMLTSCPNMEGYEDKVDTSTNEHTQFFARLYNITSIKIRKKQREREKMGALNIITYGLFSSE